MTLLDEWVRSEAVDIATKNFAFRHPTRGLYCDGPATVMASMTNDVAPRAYHFAGGTALRGNFVSVTRAGSTSPAPAIYGLSDVPGEVGPWPVDQDNSLALWVAADDVNTETTLPYGTDQAHGPLNGLSKTGTVTYLASGLNGLPSFKMDGGRLQTPINSPAAQIVSGVCAPFLFVAAVRWDAQTTNDCMFSWGSSVGGEASNVTIEVNGALQYRFRRAATTGSPQNKDASVAAPGNGVTHVVSVLFRGLSVRFDVDGSTLFDKAIDNQGVVNVDRFVLGNRLTGGVYAETAKFTCSEMMLWEGWDFSVRRLELVTMPAATSYLLQKYVGG